MPDNSTANVLPVFKLSVLDTNDTHDDPSGVRNDSNAPTLWGMRLKHISLVTLAVQNSLLSIIMHYSRVSTPPSETYSAATAVLMNEILKGLISIIIVLWRSEPLAPFAVDANTSSCTRCTSGPLARIRKLWKDIFSPDCWKLAVPAILYVIQNNLQYVAASNLEAATFQVLYQMKILTTAGFSVLLLRKKLSPGQWLSLFFLAVGVGIVQLQNSSTTAIDILNNRTMNPTKGFLAVVAACFTSGLAGVYFEMVLKSTPGDLWVRNIQLSLFSLLPAITPVLFSQEVSAAIGSPGWFRAIFHNFGGWAWATVAVQVCGGLVTAMVIKYADNILKGFATSLSIVISTVASVVLFDLRMSFPFVVGSAVVLNATWLYNQQPKRLGLATADATAFARSLNEKLRGSMRSPTAERVEESTVAFSSGSRNSSSVSLTLFSGTASPLESPTSTLALKV